MWFIVNTDKFKEQETKEFLEETYPGIVKYVYLPNCRKKYFNANGEERFRFKPLIHGLLFIKADSPAALKDILSPWGYFVYEKEVRSLADTGGLTNRKFVSRAHLLCKNVKDMSQDAMIRTATVPDEDMDRFIFFNNKIAEGIEGLTIVDKRYSDLILVNDTVRILSGPMAGWVGVVKQIKSKGKKDRHLLLRFGSDHCLSFSNIRQYDIQVEHEATKGPKAEAVGAWRAIDQMIGHLQAQRPYDNAYATLRKLFLDYQKRQTVQRAPGLSAVEHANRKDVKTEAWQEQVLSQMDASMRSNFRILSRYCQAGEKTLELWLNELMPDATLRPFLTPTSGVAIPTGKDYAILPHNGIIELILRCNLREYFQRQQFEADEPASASDEDYEYYAHFALLRTETGKIKAICSWGGFYDYYASQSREEKEKFHADLASKYYPHLLYLLTQSDFEFEKISGIPGFSIETDIDYTTDLEELGRKANEFFTLRSSLFTQLVSATVEIWQGTRLLVWRQLLQRYVLLHKVPVTDVNPDTATRQ